MPLQAKRVRQMRPSERSGPSGLWLAVGLGLVLLGYPLGLLFVMLGAPLDAWLVAYVLASVVALVAAFAFYRRRTRRARPDEAKRLSRRG